MAHLSALKVHYNLKPSISFNVDDNIILEIMELWKSGVITNTPRSSQLLRVWSHHTRYC